MLRKCLLKLVEQFNGGKPERKDQNELLGALVLAKMAEEWERIDCAWRAFFRLSLFFFVSEFLLLTSFNDP